MARRGRAIPNFSLGKVGPGFHALGNAPTAFTFTDETDADIETVYTSDPIIVAGLHSERGGASISIIGGTYAKNGGSYVSTPGTVVNGDIITVRVTSSADPETAVNAVLNIGGVSDTYTVTTAADGDAEWGHLDFANGEYVANGVTGTLADMAVGDDGATVLFDPSDIQPGVGLVAHDQNSCGLMSVGDTLAYILQGARLSFELERPASEDIVSSFEFHVLGDPTGHDANIGSFEVGSLVSGADSAEFPVSPNGGGFETFTVTISDTSFAIDGAASATLPVADPPAALQEPVYFVVNGLAILRKVTILPLI